MRPADVTMNTMKRFLLLLLVGVGLLCVGSGCQSLQDPYNGAGDPKPWNAPAGWEGSMFGLPY